MNAITKEIFESFQLPADTVGYPILVITIVTLYIHWIISGIISEKERVKLASYQREIYCKRLLVESLRMEERKLSEAKNEIDTIKQLAQESNRIKFQLGDDDTNDNGGVSDQDLKATSSSCDESCESSVGSEFSDIERLQARIEQMRSQEKELELVNESLFQIEGIEFEETDNLIEEVTAATNEINERIDKLEATIIENKKKIDEIIIDTLPISDFTKIDPELMRQFENVELESLEKFQDSLLELRASVSTLEEFDEYLQEVKGNKQNQAVVLTEAIIRNKETEIRLHHFKEKASIESQTLMEERTELVLKLNGATELLGHLREKNELQRKLVVQWKEELEYTEQELTKWRNILEETMEYARAVKAQ